MVDASEERAARRLVADRARRRAAQAGARAEELRARLSALRDRQERGTPLPPSPEAAREAIAQAMERREEAALNDRRAHEAAARAHDRAAAAYERLAATGPPGHRQEYAGKARAHRAAAARDREAGAGPTGA